MGTFILSKQRRSQLGIIRWYSLKQLYISLIFVSENRGNFLTTIKKQHEWLFFLVLFLILVTIYEVIVFELMTSDLTDVIVTVEPSVYNNQSIWCVFKDMILGELYSFQFNTNQEEEERN